MRRVKILAPAKINLHLEVGSKRPDGFHDICSLFQGISLYDDILVSFKGNPGDIQIHGDFDCPVRSNIIYKAAVLFREYTGENKGLVFDVKKRIPPQAGLGGGSSDAAASLKALFLLFERKADKAALAEMAAKLGSDVPFFLGGSTALVTGRGEILEALEDGPFLHAVIVRDDGPGISTATAYKALDQGQNRNPPSAASLSRERIIENFTRCEPPSWPFFNSFMETCRKDNKALELILNLLYDAKAEFASLTGSGAAFFGLFNTERAAKKAETALKDHFPFVERIYFIDSIPNAFVV